MDDDFFIACGTSAAGAWLTLAASFGAGPTAQVLDVVGVTICAASWASLVVAFPADSWTSLWRASRSNGPCTRRVRG